MIDVVTMAEAAERLGLANLRAYRRNHATFPQPINPGSHSPVWRWRDIERWYLTTITPRKRKDKHHE